MRDYSDEKIQVLGIGGSLRKNSYNRALLRAAQELAPDEMAIRIFDNAVLSAIPLFNEDVRQQGEPEPVKILKTEIRNADALLFAIPEYNYSFSGVLKNAIDWASRPPNKSPLKEKPVALIGASTGISGTIRAQMHFRQVCIFTDMLAVNTPQVFVANAAQKFDAKGRLIDEDTRKFVRQLTESLFEWTRRLRYGNLMNDIRDGAVTSPGS
ncbi:MAG: NADPH-dependent FMN reductase [Anaerolineales bacterium]